MSDAPPQASPNNAPSPGQEEALDLQQELTLLRRKNALQALELELLQKEFALELKKQEQDTLRMRLDNERLHKKNIAADRELENLRDAAHEINYLLAPCLAVDMDSGELSQTCKILSFDLKWLNFSVRLLWPKKRF